MRLISAIMNFYWSHTIARQKLFKQCYYTFSSILILTEVIITRKLRFFSCLKKWRPLNSANAEEPKRHIKKLFATTDRQTDDDRRQMKLRSNTHGCELITRNEFIQKEAERKTIMTLTMLCKAITVIDLLIGVGLDKNCQEISADESKAGKRIFSDAIEKLGEPSPVVLDK